MRFANLLLHLIKKIRRFDRCRRRSMLNLRQIDASRKYQFRSPNKTLSKSLLKVPQLCCVGKWYVFPC